MLYDRKLRRQSWDLPLFKPILIDSTYIFLFQFYFPVVVASCELLPTSDEIKISDTIL